MKSISEMVHEYQVAVRSLRLDGVRSNIVPNSVVAAILKAAEYHQVVVVHARAVVMDLLLDHKKMMAIKAYKDLVCVGLKEAKDVVDEMDARINPPQNVLSTTQSYEEYSYYVGEELTCNRIPKKYGTWMSDLKSDDAARAAHHGLTGSSCADL